MLRSTASSLSSTLGSAVNKHDSGCSGNRSISAPCDHPAMKSTDVVVVGGGCIGLASAIALAGRGTNVILVERGLPGAANSTLTGGGIRQQFGSELNVRLSQLSAETWDGFEERFGVDPRFRRI